MKTLVMTLTIMNATLLYAADQGLNYPIVDTGQVRCYSHRAEIAYPQAGKTYFGQDAQYNGLQPAYRNNGDGTVTDLNTRLMWTQDPGTKKTYPQAIAEASACRVGGYTDWRLPTIKELYSLILFSGTDPDPMSTQTSDQRPFIDTRYFKFQYGKPAEGDRIIDSQFATSTIYRSTTMNGQKTLFGVNFADGRIKGYPYGAIPGRGAKTFYVLYVRDNLDYGKNRFLDNGDGTITDKATGLTWMKIDSGHLQAGNHGTMNWSQALQWAEGLDYAGRTDWRLPNAKELHSIVDYSRCPDVTNSAAIDPMFDVTSITNEGGVKDYPYYWTSTSHVGSRGSAGVYIAFGRALGKMQFRGSNQTQLMDVHGAGAQRSDEKSGSPSRYPLARGPQGDIVRVYSMVRCVRGGTAEPRTVGPAMEKVQWSQRQERYNSYRGQAQGPGFNMETNPSERSTGEGFIPHLDRDGDGQASRQEFDGPAQHFQQFDYNQDDQILVKEAPQGPSFSQGGPR